MVLGLREVVRARCADQAREVGHSRATRVGISECKFVTLFRWGSFARERAAIKESVTRSGRVRCELGDKALIVIVRGGVDVVQLGVQAVISACRGSSFAAARYPRP